AAPEIYTLSLHDALPISEELFENGLPAWKIAVIFRIEFEHLEKELFVKRKGYGHNKKNPFTINTDHKQFVNESIIKGIRKKSLRSEEHTSELQSRENLVC